MMKTRVQKFAWLIVVVIGFLTGYFWADDSAEIRKLRTELYQLRTSRQTTLPRLPMVASRTLLKPTSTPGPSLPHDPTNKHTTISGLLARAKVTPGEIAATLALEKRRDEGEFLLRDERPVFKKLQDHDFESITSQTASNNAEAYNRAFSTLGIPAEKSEQLQNHLAKIHKASLECEASIAQVMDARREYDKRIRSVLSEEDYSRYRQFEESKPAWNELENIQQFFVETGNSALNSQQQQTLASLIQTAKATEEGWWHGPYDPLPQVKMGKDEVLPWAERQLKQITESAGQVLGRLPEVGLPEEFRNLLRDYYANKIQQRQNAIEMISKPRDVRNAIAVGQDPHH